MLNQENIDKCGMIMNYSTLRLQLLILIEELAELQQAATKMLRNAGVMEPKPTENFYEEIVDVYVMLQQMQEYYGFTDIGINVSASRKLDRAIVRFRNGGNR